MLPNIDIGPLHLSTYTAVYIVALLVAGMYSFHRLLTRLGQPPEIIIRGLFLSILGGFVGPYLVRVVIAFQRLFQTGELAWVGGSSFVGLLIGGVGVGALYCRFHKIPLGLPFDLAAPALALAQAIGRLGCLAAGCCFGLPTDSWLGTVLPDHDDVWLPRYPTQLMAAAANLFIFLLLLAVERYGLRRPNKPTYARTWPFDGFLFLLYAGLYCLKRFLLEFLRGDAIPVLGPLSWAQLYTLVGLVVIASLTIWNLRRTSANKLVPEAHNELASTAPRPHET